jgi:hypothetical protein
MHADTLEGDLLMEDSLFNEVRAQIDRDVDADETGYLGIAMGFGLAGEFLTRGLVKTVKFKMIVDWESKIYRDRHVYPDPMMDEFAYRIGSP